MVCIYLNSVRCPLEQYKELGVHKLSERDEVTFWEQIEMLFLKNVLRNLDERFRITQDSLLHSTSLVLL